MKIAIVGNKGFIGKNIVGSDNFADDDLVLFNSNQSIWASQQNLKAEFLECESVIWAAGKVNPILAESKPELVKLEINEFTKVVDMLVSNNSINLPRLIFLSSGGCTYTALRSTYREDDQALGINVYGKMKIDQENILTERIPNSVIVRLSNVYGPGQPAGRGQGVIAEWFNSVKIGQTPKVYGNLNSTRDYLHIKDTITAIKLLTRSKTSGVINIGSGMETTLKELTEVFSQILSLSFTFEMKEKRNFDRMKYRLDIEKAKSELLWIPKIDIYSGIISLFHNSIQE